MVFKSVYKKFLLKLVSIIILTSIATIDINDAQNLPNDANGLDRYKTDRFGTLHHYTNKSNKRYI